MSWMKNNRAHTSMWFFEKWHHDQRSVKFTPAGEWSTDFLIKAAAGEALQTRSEKAQTHAEMLDGVFVSLYGATYEKGVTSKAAIAAMVTILNDSTKKLKDLGDPVDAAYKFL